MRSSVVHCRKDGRIVAEQPFASPLSDAASRPDCPVGAAVDAEPGLVKPLVAAQRRVAGVKRRATALTDQHGDRVAFLIVLGVSVRVVALRQR